MTLCHPRSAVRALGFVALPLTLVLIASACAAGERCLEVDATAYNSLPGQTDGDPNLTAWGDRLEPGMKSIAVSRDLIDQGLGHEARVRIDGLEGTYRVLDKMARRWKKKIDIYMGEDVEAARRWGRRKVVLCWDAE